MYLELGRLWFMFWIKNPDKESMIFNELAAPLPILGTCYAYLVHFGCLTAIEDMDPGRKLDFQRSCEAIDPQASTFKKTAIMKAIQLFDYYVSIKSNA